LFDTYRTERKQAKVVTLCKNCLREIVLSPLLSEDEAEFCSADCHKIWLRLRLATRRWGGK
jgi:hypothetical protein